MQNSYFIYLNGDTDNSYFSIQSYDVNGLLRASFSETPFIDAPMWIYYDLNILWDQFSSQLFVAELVHYYPGTGYKVRIYRFDSSLNLVTISTAIVSVSPYDRVISFISNQQGQLFLYMQYNGIYVYDTSLNVLASGVPPTPIITLFGESGCDASGNALFVINSSNNSLSLYQFIVQKVDINASVLWSMVFPYVPYGELNNPSSLLISPDMLRFFYASGTSLLLQTLSHTGMPLSSTTVLDSPADLQLISTAQNANGRIFIYTDTGVSGTLRELSEVGSILWSISITGTNQFLRALRCDNQYLWLIYSDTEFQLRQFLLERPVQVTELVCETAIVSICNTCLTPPAPPQIQEPTTPNQLSFILDKAVACPTRYVTPYATSGCQPLYTDPIPPLTGPDVEPPQGPAVVTVYRKFPRIGGIDDISKPLVGRSSSDRTARLRAGIISQSQTRYVQTVLPVVPYPARPSNPPQPGVPVAPMSGCNPGARRVDFSNPRA
jgi:hypothetical protein